MIKNNIPYEVTQEVIEEFTRCDFEVAFDDMTRLVYSTDASIYQRMVMVAEFTAKDRGYAGNIVQRIVIWPRVIMITNCTLPPTKRWTSI